MFVFFYPVYSFLARLFVLLAVKAYKEVLEKDLKVMDSTAASLCRDNDIKIHVFGIAEEGNVMRAVCGEKIGTIIS